MYQVLYNSEHSPVDIAKWLNEELALGNKLVACNGDFYIFEAVEQTLAPDVATVCPEHGEPVSNLIHFACGCFVTRPAGKA